MPKDKLKTIYVCNQCGETSPRWLGRCPSCGAWNTMTEDVVAEPAKSSSGRAAAPVRVTGQTSLKPLKLKNVSTTEEKSRIVTGIAELDRVLGGGIVLGSVILSGLFGWFFLPDLLIHCLVIGVLGGIVSQFGDLTASIFKRKMGIKDYGHLIPGHGGILDRFDSVLFTGPMVYYYIVLVIGYMP